MKNNNVKISFDEPIVWKRKEYYLMIVQMDKEMKENKHSDNLKIILDKSLKSHGKIFHFVFYQFNEKGKKQLTEARQFRQSGNSLEFGH